MPACQTQPLVCVRQFAYAEHVRGENIGMDDPGMVALLRMAESL